MEGAKRCISRLNALPHITLNLLFWISFLAWGKALGYGKIWQNMSLIWPFGDGSSFWLWLQWGRREVVTIYLEGLHAFECHSHSTLTSLLLLLCVCVRATMRNYCGAMALFAAAATHGNTRNINMCLHLFWIFWRIMVDNGGYKHAIACQSLLSGISKWPCRHMRPAFQRRTACPPGKSTNPPQSQNKTSRGPNPTERKWKAALQGLLGNAEMYG